MSLEQVEERVRTGGGGGELSEQVQGLFGAARASFKADPRSLAAFVAAGRLGGFRGQLRYLVSTFGQHLTLEVRRALALL